MPKSKAFTLIELLVVIAIIGLLTTISVIAVNNARAKARDTERVADIKQIQTALELYFNDVGSYPTSSAILTPGQAISYGSTTYMATVPAPPSTADGICFSASQYIYNSSSDGSSYTISFCLGGPVAQLASGHKCATPEGISDNDCSGNVVTIGTQVWLVKNLNVGTKVNNGESEPACHALFNVYWSCQTSSNEKYCYNDNDAICTTDGGLYEWAQAMGLPYYCNYAYFTCDGANCVSEDYVDCNYPDPAATPRQGICPTGYHIPSDTEWTILTDYLANNGYAGFEATALKALSTNSIPWDGNDNFGFTALPASYRAFAGAWAGPHRGQYAAFWSSSPSSYSDAHSRSIYFDSFVYSQSENRTHGLSVRCLQD